MYKTADCVILSSADLVTDEAMQRFGFSAAHLQLTMPVGSLEVFFGLQYLRVSKSLDDPAWHSGRQNSASTFVQLRSQCAGRELSAAARKFIGRATGFAN